MQGLQRLVKLRGGLENGMNQFTRRLVLWYVLLKAHPWTILSCVYRADLNCANALGSDPIFNILESSEKTTLELLHLVPPAGKGLPIRRYSLQSETPGFKNLEALSMELKDSFTTLKYFAEIDTSAGVYIRKGKDEKIQDSDKLYATERSLLVLANIWGPKKFATSG